MKSTATVSILSGLFCALVGPLIPSLAVLILLAIEHHGRSDLPLFAEIIWSFALVYGWLLVNGALICALAGAIGGFFLARRALTPISLQRLRLETVFVGAVLGVTVLGSLYRVLWVLLRTELIGWYLVAWMLLSIPTGALCAGMLTVLLPRNR